MFYLYLHYLQLHSLSPEHLPLSCPNNSHDGRHLGFWQYLRHRVAKNGKNVFLTSENLGVDTKIITL